MMTQPNHEDRKAFLEGVETDGVHSVGDMVEIEVWDDFENKTEHVVQLRRYWPHLGEWLTTSGFFADLSETP